jgi:serine/threonine-protein kinase
METLRRARWAELSERLDELLDLPDDAARIAAMLHIRAEDPPFADELQRLLDELPRIEQQGFLEQPVMAAPPQMAGRRIGAYTLEHELGEGGMGSVWRARRSDGRYDGLVAVKFLHGGLTGHVAAERFAHEGLILGRLTHPHIARLLDAGVLDGTQPYLMLEYVEGLPIDKHCDAHALGVKDRVRLFLDVLGAVAHAHTRLILHRDLKPSNILVTEDGQVKLLDFGIAKLLGQGEGGAAGDITQRAGRAFTPQYAAPEQLQGGEVTTATDVYALGVLLYGLLSGRHPTVSRTEALLDQMRAIVEMEPMRLPDAALKAGGPEAKRRARELRGDLDNIVAKALRKAPGERYANAEALADDLRRYLDHEPVAARADSAGYRLAKFVRRYRVGVAAGAVTVTALGVGIGVALWQAREARHQQAEAEGLVEFMLGDLRKKLQPVGRLDVLDSVGEKALDHYDRQEAAALNADALGRRARALHLLGEIADQRGQQKEALRLFQRAAESTAALLQRAPRDAQRMYDHSQSVFWVGYIERQRGELARAGEAFREYMALADRMVALEPGKLEWRVEQAMAAQNLGVWHLDADRPRDALAQFDKVVTMWTKLLPQRPESGFELAQTWGFTARGREMLGDSPGALAANEAKLQALDQMPGSRGNRDSEVLRATIHSDIARLALDLGDARRAEPSSRAGVALLDQLTQRDPANLNWRRRSVAQHLLLLNVLLANGKRDEALAAWPDTRDQGAALLQQADAGDRTRQLSLAGALLLMRQRLQGDVTEADFDAYLQTNRGFAESGHMTDPDHRRLLATVLIAAGDRARAAGHEDTARSHWQAAAALLSGPITGDASALLTQLAQARLRLGDVAGAQALANRVAATSYRHPAQADLVQRLAAAGRGAPVNNPNEGGKP